MIIRSEAMEGNELNEAWLGLCVVVRTFSRPLGLLEGTFGGTGC